jgi:hypothetical protein
MIVNPFRFGGGGGYVPVVNTDWSTTGSGTSISISRGIGTANANRWVIVAFAINYNAGRTITAVTIGGVSASLLYASPDPLTVGGAKTEYWTANVPTGTTATIAATTDNSMFDGALFVWTANSEPTLFDGQEDLTISSASFSLTIDVPEGGAVLAVCNNNAGGSTVSSLSGVTQDVLSAARRIFAGSEDLLPAETARTISVTWNTGSPNPTYDGLSAISVSF